MLHTNRGGIISFLEDGVVGISSLGDGEVGNDNTCSTCNEITISGTRISGK